MSHPYEKALKLLVDPDVKLRIKALHELAKLRPPECVNDILHILEKDDDDDVKIAAIQTLAVINEISAGPTLIKMLSLDNIPIAMEAVVALGIITAQGYTPGVTALEKMLDHPNFRIRKFTIIVLGECGGSTTIEKLYDHFKKDETSIESKELIATAIGKIGGARAIEILQSLVGITSEVSELKMEVRRAAIAALGEARIPAALDILGKVYNDKKEHKVVRKYAEDAIKKTVDGAYQQFLLIKKHAEDIFHGK